MAKKISKKLLKWRKRQKRGAIMKPSTFNQIVRDCMRKNPSYGKARCTRIAGKSYWSTAKAKFRKKNG